MSGRSCGFLPNKINLELHLGCHTCWLSYFTLVCLWCGGTVARSLARCTVTWLPNFLGWVDYHISLAMGLRPRAALRYQFRSSFNVKIKLRLTSLLTACTRRHWWHWRDSNNFCTFHLHKLNCRMNVKTPADTFRPFRFQSVAVFIF